MPLYRFALQGDDPPLDQPPEYFHDDVEALKVGAEIAADLARNREGPHLLIVAVRVPGGSRQ